VRVSRRNFVHALGVGTAGSFLAPMLGGRGLEAMAADPFAMRSTHPHTGTAIRINSNENPDGPSPAALDAITRQLGQSNRYPGDTHVALIAAIAASHGVAPENVLIGCGSTDILRAAVSAYTGPGKALITASPTFESTTTDATRLGAPVTAVPVRGDLKLDLDAMAAASSGAGLLYLCNPNNPTSTVHGAQSINDCVARVLRDTPTETILIDEAYHEYVDEPSYSTAVPLAMANPRVIVARTFSKVHGLAGLRVGYAIARPETIAVLRPWVLPVSVNQLGAAAALASIGVQARIDRERARNREAREFTRKVFADAGYPSVVSDANFIMVDVRRPSTKFAEGCKANGVLVGRPFPPLTNYARISIGTMDEMRQASDVFRRVLATA